MATLKDHQQAMVDLLASGSGIPASASRLAHAMHDVLCYLTEVKPVALDMKSVIRAVEANSPGLNDKALAADVEACRKHPWQKPDVTIRMDLYERACAAERRVKELENTVKQLRASNAVLRAERDELRAELDFVDAPEQSGCRKDDTQVCDHLYEHEFGDTEMTCITCGKKELV